MSEELMDRIDRLEAEANVMRRYIRALISMLPETRQINGVLADVSRQINADIKASPDLGQLAQAGTAFAALRVKKLGLLGTPADPQSSPARR